MSDIKVETHSGFKADEYPVRFSIGERRFEIIYIDDRWYDPEYSCFRVFADDGGKYLLKQSFKNDEWEVVRI
ncbi:MAG: hypothetical protein JW902_12675 [Syntrophaceae bacterium]|nr:hypothetical protein [Syntrophaceae bacterium]